MMTRGNKGGCDIMILRAGMVYYQIFITYFIIS